MRFEVTETNKYAEPSQITSDVINTAHSMQAFLPLKSNCRDYQKCEKILLIGELGMQWTMVSGSSKLYMTRIDLEPSIN